MCQVEFSGPTRKQKQRDRTASLFRFESFLTCLFVAWTKCSYTRNAHIYNIRYIYEAGVQCTHLRHWQNEQRSIFMRCGGFVAGCTRQFHSGPGDFSLASATSCRDSSFGSHAKPLAARGRSVARCLGLSVCARYT